MRKAVDKILHPHGHSEDKHEHHHTSTTEEKIIAPATTETHVSSAKVINHNVETATSETIVKYVTTSLTTPVLGLSFCPYKQCDDRCLLYYQAYNCRANSTSREGG